MLLTQGYAYHFGSKFTWYQDDSMSAYVPCPPVCIISCWHLRWQDTLLCSAVFSGSVTWPSIRPPMNRFVLHFSWDAFTGSATARPRQQPCRWGADLGDCGSITHKCAACAGAAARVEGVDIFQPLWCVIFQRYTQHSVILPCTRVQQ
jgi:hypothetical protein